MYRFRCEIDAIGQLPELVGVTCVDYLLEALTAIDAEWLALHPEAPSVYSSGVRYTYERDDVWTDVPATLRAGLADCEDLSCWRAAELRIRHGIGAVARARIERATPGDLLYHAIVRWPDGTIEDPSRRLGMR